MNATNIVLFIVIIVMAVVSVIYFLKNKRNAAVEAKVNVDNKTYNLETMKEFVKTRLDWSFRRRT